MLGYTAEYDGDNRFQGVLDNWNDVRCYTLGVGRRHLDAARHAVTVAVNADGDTAEDLTPCAVGTARTWCVWERLKLRQLGQEDQHQHTLVVPVGAPRGLAIPRLALALLRLEAEWEIECRNAGSTLPHVCVEVDNPASCEQLQQLLSGVQLDETQGGGVLHFGSLEHLYLGLLTGHNHLRESE